MITVKTNVIDQVLKALKNVNLFNSNFCYLNISSVRNKFTDLQTIVNGNVDIISIAETKLEASFPSAWFILGEYHTPYRLDTNNKSGGVWLFICCKTKLKKKRFFLKKYMFFTKYTLFAEKMFLYGKKVLY